jgi:hypothetical protein
LHYIHYLSLDRGGGMKSLKEKWFEMFQKWIESYPDLEILDVKAFSNVGTILFQKKDDILTLGKIHYDFQDKYSKFTIEVEGHKYEILMDYNDKKSGKRFSDKFHLLCLFLQNKTKASDFCELLSKEKFDNLDELTKIYEDYCDTFHLPALSADELILESYEDFPYHSKNLNLFLQTWEETEEIESSQHMKP